MQTTTQAAQDNNNTRIRKSEAMSKSERVKFEKWVNSHPTKIDAAEVLGISRQNMDAILNRGTGKPGNIAKIRSLIATV